MMSTSDRQSRAASCHPDMGSDQRRVLLLQRGAENVAERGAGVGRAELCDGFLLFGDFQRLDRQADLAVFLSNWVTRASTVWPTEKRSGRCSSRSRDRSERRMKAVRSVIDDLHFEATIGDRSPWQVTTAFLRSSPEAAASPIGPCQAA
jgi:hypothetical protein